MGDFAAKLELPRFIPKEEILGKYVFDSEVVCIGLVEDWTYSSDGEIKMVVKAKDGAKNSTVFIPFYHIDRVGQFVLLKTKRENFIEKLELEPKVEKGKKEEKKEEKNEPPKNEELRYFHEIDEKKINQLIKKKK